MPGLGFDPTADTNDFEKLHYFIGLAVLRRNHVYTLTVGLTDKIKINCLRSPVLNMAGHVLSTLRPTALVPMNLKRFIGTGAVGLTCVKTHSLDTVNDNAVKYPERCPILE